MVLLAARAFAFPNLRELAPAYAGVFALLDRQTRTAEASPCHHSSERKSYRLDRQARTAEASPCHRSSRASARIGGPRGKGAMHSPLSAGRPILVCLAR